MIKDDLEKILGFNVEPTENLAFGDYSSNVALQGKNPRQTAEELVKKLKLLKPLNNLIEKIEVAGPGFINFYLARTVLTSELENIVKVGKRYGFSDKNNGKLAIVEYSSPNIAKPFGVGHLRSTVVGDAIANLMEATGYKVMRDNHLGDWGTQFGKMIYAIKTWGNEEKIANSKNPVKELVSLYVKFHEEAKKDEKIEDEARAWFRKLEKGDSEARRLWQKCIDWSFVEFDKIYNLMGIKFSPEFNGGRGLGESFFENRMTLIIDELNKNKLLKVGEEGAQLVFFEKDKYPPLMVLKKDGATLYATRDLATDKYRKEKYDPDIIINEVGSEQSLYFKQLFETEKLLGWYKDGQRVHVGHGLYLVDGKKMSTRGGASVNLEEVLEEAVKRAMKIGKKDKSDESAARQVGIGAIKYFDLSHHPQTNINFDWDSMFALEGNSSPYLQYTIARCNSVIQKANVQDHVLTYEYSNLNSGEFLILRALIRFPEVMQEAAINYSPNLLCNYLYDLAQKFNSFYGANKIIGSENEKFRLVLTSATAQVLKNGLKLLGIESPEKM